MKAFILCVATVLTAPLLGHAQNWLNNGLVAYYPFSGNANDASGNGNHGNPGTAQITSDRFENSQSAYSFNGIDSFITFARTPMTNVDNISMFCWIKPKILPQWGIALILGTATGGGTAPCNGFAMGIGQATGNTLVGRKLIGANSCVAWVDGNYTFLSTNSWQHVGFIRQNGQDHFYVDGQRVASVIVGAPSPPTEFCIGTLLGSDRSNAVFNGFIDDVRVYNRAFSSNEVSQLYEIEGMTLLSLKKAIYPESPNLRVGSNYQLQVSSNMETWTNYGQPFTATNSYWRASNYWDVETWNKLFFRLQNP